MSTVEKSIRLYAWRQNYHVIDIVQDEVLSRHFNIQLMENTTPVNLANCRVYFHVDKPDSNTVYVECDVVNAADGQIRVTLSYQMAACDGLANCFVQVVSQSDTDLRFDGLQLNVKECNLTESAESSSEFPALVKALSEVVPATERANDAAVNADRAARESDDQTGLAKKATTAANNAAASANQATSNAITATSSANNATSAAIAATENAVTAKQNADLAAQNANKAADEAREAVFEELPNNETLIRNVAEQVPVVKVAEQPTFVDAISEMKDTSKMYVLNTDGMFYHYVEKTTVTPGGTTPNFKNQVPISIDTDGSIFNGTGYKEDVRLSSNGSISGTPVVGSVTSGFIPYTPGAIIRIKGVEFVGAKQNFCPSGHFYLNFYDKNFNYTEHIGAANTYDDDDATVAQMSYDEATGACVIDTSGCIGNNSASASNVNRAKYIRINAYGKGADFIVTVNEEITYTTTEGSTVTTRSWESTGISYNQPADYEDRVIEAEADIDNLKNKSADLTNRVNELENSGGAGNGGGGDDESCYNVQMNRLYADGILRENAVMAKALEAVCNQRNGSTQSRQVINLKKHGKQKLILHLHKRANDGYDTVNDVYLPNAQTDFSDVRITTDTGKVLKYHTVYSGNVDVLSDSRIGNSDVSFLSDDAGNIYIGRSGGVYKSTDAGKTWSKIAGITESVVHVAYVCGDGTLFFGNKSGVLFKSAPPYTTSKAVIDTSEGGTYTGMALRPFQFVQLPTGEMLLGSYQSQFAPRIWKSTNNGENWTKIYEVIGGTYQHVHRMYVDTYQTPVAVYAGLDRGSGGSALDAETGSYYHISGTVLKSTDGGVTWVDLYADQKGKAQAVDHGVVFADKGYRLLGGETGIVGGSSIVRTTDDINFTAVLSTDHAVYGPEKLNGYIFAGGCGSGGGVSATLYISEDEGITWKQIYSEEPNAQNTLASAGIKTFLKGVFAGTNYEQLIAHNNCSSLHRPSKRIFAGGDNWYSEIIVDVPEGTNSITVESGYLCPNLTVLENDCENVGDAVFIMDLNENGNYLKEKVSGKLYKGENVFADGGKHLGYVYPDITAADDMHSIKLSSSLFDNGIKKMLNFKADELGLTISFWLNNTVNGRFELIRVGSDVLHLEGLYVRCNTRHIVSPLTTEGGRFVKIDIVFDSKNNVIKAYKNGVCDEEITDQTKIDLFASMFTGEKDCTLLKRGDTNDDVTAIQHFEIRHGVPTDKEVYDSYFGGLTDNYY